MKRRISRDLTNPIRQKKMIDNYIAIVITTLSKNIYMIFTITGYIQPNTPIGYHTELISAS
jgi:hypothetical protein